MSGGETALFWVVAPLMVLGGLGLLLAKKAVHAALCMALVMICLGMVYFAQQAAFLGAVQIFVYTGAVMMLFLFVLMLVGVDSSDSLVETIRGQRLAAALLGVGLVVLLISGLAGVTFAKPVGLGDVNAEGNLGALAGDIFGAYVFAFEATGALLITAALGAMILAHRERFVPRETQREQSVRRIREGIVKAPLPAPGVFARHNAVDTPALLPDGTPSELSVSRVLTARGQMRPTSERAGEVTTVLAEIEDPFDLTPSEPDSVPEAESGSDVSGKGE
ncbi:MAG: NADH-quinone oxidoreductase subunit J [Kineosporiaceae bacterium]|nr:NADH-quinone oxidoreductase subunit J [Kineosporiaceae bacterium]MBK7624040.1 NADH-quinone oxidoreductase subunit J [Kineosporiaceae bacterium]MBK8075795.1 NADH-quinone oxidoreductase subunit J [Kineosporiaceae bacterium]